MGRVSCKVTVLNAVDKRHQVDFDALVDTGASGMMLPDSFKAMLGELEELEPAWCTLADGSKRMLTRCGPVKIQLADFPEIYDEVFFLPPDRDGKAVEALIGYIVLEKSRACADMVGHRLLKVDACDLKGIQRHG